MFDTGYNQHQVTELLSAMLSVAPDRDVEHQPAKHFVTAIRDYLFKMPDINLDKLPQTTPEDFVKAFSNEQQLRQSLQLLIIMPYLSGKLHNDDVQRVDEYAQAANLSPGSLQDLNNLVNNRIKKALINYTRRGTNEFLPGSPVQKLKSIVREIHSLAGDKKRADDYEQLSTLETGTLGKTLFNFYNGRDFKFPGQKGNIGESAVRHDCVHILSGTNTDYAGEIAVSAIEATMVHSEVGWEMVTEVMVDFHLGIAWTLPSGIKPESMHFDPELFSKGLALGSKINIDLIHDWNFWDDIKTPISELRQRFNITDVDIIDMPAPDKNPDAKTSYWNID
jgi:hypothetical protein